MVNWKKWFLEEDEDEIFEEEISRKEKKESSLETRERRTENKRKERVYYEDEEDFEIDFSSRKSKRTFEEDEFESDFGNRRKREKTQEKFEDYEEVNLEDFEIDKFEDDDYEVDFEQERKSKKETGFFTKFKNLFKQNDEELDDDFLDEELLEEDKDDEAEDYKTYLERQKREQKEKAKLAKKEQSRVAKEEDFEDYEDEEEYEEDKKVGFFSRLKDKLFNVSEDEIDQEELEAVLDDYEEEEYEEETPVKKKPQVSVERFDSEPEEELEIEFVDEVKEEAKFEEIDITKYEEKEEKASAGTVTKNKEARKEFEENFNSLERRSDKIEKDNPLYVKKNEKLDGIFDEIREKESKTHEKEAPALEVRELDAEGSRREKLKYTSVHDVLEGNEDLFEDDIDRVSKKLVGERFEESQESSEEVENFRKGLYEGKKSENTQERTALDELIKTENIDVSPRKEETLPEIEELNENLADLKKEKQEETYVDLVQEAAKIEDMEVEDYEEIKEVKKDRLSGYSDYHLNEDEIEELEEQNYLEESADSVNIDSLIREVSPNNKIIKKANDVDKFTDEKVVPKEVVEKRVEDAKAHEESEQVEEVERGIDYTEKLYTNDVSEYFDKGNGTKLGEYKTVDYGYRPVSKEKIENNQKILDAIFEKYSSSGISTSTKSVTSQMMSSNTITPKSRSVGKFKPSPVYSSVYGSATRNTAENSNKPVGISTTGLSINNQVSKTTPEVKRNEPKLVEKKAVEAEAATEISNANIYKETAS